VRLSGAFASAGSVYGLVGAVLGPRAGFVAGWALLGTYLVFPAVSISAAAVFGTCADPRADAIVLAKLAGGDGPRGQGVNAEWLRLPHGTTFAIAVAVYVLYHNIWPVPDSPFNLFPYVVAAWDPDRRRRRVGQARGQ
jgi:amino acid transporter